MYFCHRLVHRRKDFVAILRSQTIFSNFFKMVSVLPGVGATVQQCYKLVDTVNLEI